MFSRCIRNVFQEATWLNNQELPNWTHRFSLFGRLENFHHKFIFLEMHSLSVSREPCKHLSMQCFTCQSSATIGKKMRQSVQIGFCLMEAKENIYKPTRMHSSRMRTVRCMGRLRGRVSVQGGVCLCVCVGGGGLSAWGVSPWAAWGVSVLGVHRILDTRL